MYSAGRNPAYLLVGEGYAPSFKALMEETEWHRYGNGINPKCANCMVHSGYEASAVEDAIKRPWQALKDGPARSPHNRGHDPGTAQSSMLRMMHCQNPA